jgi:hypothetical protein
MDKIDAGFISRSSAWKDGAGTGRRCTVVRAQRVNCEVFGNASRNPNLKEWANELYNSFSRNLLVIKKESEMCSEFLNEVTCRQP